MSSSGKWFEFKDVIMASHTVEECLKGDEEHEKRETWAEIDKHFEQRDDEVLSTSSGVLVIARCG
jgi:hypothetical protein